jgi:hypothetical protein
MRTVAIFPRLSHAAASAGVVATLVFGFAGAAQAQPPSLNIQQTCRSAANAMVKLMGGGVHRDHFDHCVESEQKARERMVQDWATFAAADKARCVQPRAYQPNFVEWQSCLESARDARKLGPSGPTPESTSLATLPAVQPIIPAQQSRRARSAQQTRTRLANGS